MRRSTTSRVTPPERSIYRSYSLSIRLRQFCYWARRSDCCRSPDGELARSGQPSDPTAAQRYLANAFGDHLDKARRAINELASRYEPAELNRIGFSLYEKFRPAVP